MTPPPSRITQKRGMTIILVTAFILLGGTTTALWLGSAFSDHAEGPPSGPQYFTAAPVSEKLSQEAHEGCLAVGMTSDQIGADMDACLETYWTTERLVQSSRTTNDWLSDQRVELTCDSKGYIPAKEGAICELGAGPMPQLPFPHDPWWDEQKTRDPGRTTDLVPIPQKGVVYTEEDWEQAYTASMSAEPVPLGTLDMETFLIRWCNESRVIDPSSGGPISKKAWDPRETIVDARPCLIDLFAEHHNGTNW